MLMTVIDRENFPSIGSGLWWAVQTVTTVGYGDVVPATAAGRIVAAVVMLLGIGFVTVITASITGAFVARSRRDQQAGLNDGPSAEQFRLFDERLARIEAALNSRP
jgi:voltage-gated potassium channel